MYKKMFLFLFVFIAFLNTFVYAAIGPYTVSQVSSNPVWVPDSDKIAYLELVDYCQAQVVTSKTYKLELVLNIKSLSDPLYHKKITWVIPEDEWTKMADAHLSFSPEGDKIVFSIGHSIFTAELKDNSKFQKIVDNGLNPEWSPDGSMIVYQEEYNKPTKLISRDDGKIFLIDNTGRATKIYTCDENGKRRQEIAGAGQKPKWSSDGNKIIFSAADKIFITDKDAKSIRQINVPYKEVGEPALSPDMTKVVFSKYRYEENFYRLENNLYIADAATGSIIKEIIKPNGTCANRDAPIFDAVWSPNGEYIAYMYNCSAGGIFVIKNDGSGLKSIAGYRSHYGWD